MLILFFPLFCVFLDSFFFLKSCLALRYEALVMRELKSASSQWLQVSPVEWLNFVEDAVHNGFHAVAEKVSVNTRVLYV